MKKKFFFCGFGGLFWLSTAMAQVTVDAPGYSVRVQQGSGVEVKSNAKDSVGLGSDVEVDGITTINGKLYIDGESVPKGKTSFTSKKTRKTYRIDWGKDGNISVTEK